MKQTVVLGLSALMVGFRRDFVFREELVDAQIELKVLLNKASGVCLNVGHQRMLQHPERTSAYLTHVNGAGQVSGK